MKTLRFRPDGTFTIVQFTDLHIHNEDNEAEKTLKLMTTVLQAEKPDLVVLTGDTIAGKQCTDPRASYRLAVSPMEEAGIPWAAVFGNHDDEGIHDRSQLMALQQSCAYSLSQPGPADVPGIGNYVLNVLSSTDSDPAAILYFLDSGSYADESIDGYDWIKPKQIEWYRQVARQLGQDRPNPLPALAFFHIPVPEYDYLWLHGIALGDKYENVCAPRLNSGFFLNLVEVGDVLGTFVGHDHVNDFEGELLGIRLCYGRAGGYGTYGREGFARGARMIRLTQGQRSFETWLRLADGTVVPRVVVPQVKK